MKSFSLDIQGIQDDFQNLPKDVGAWPLMPRVAALVGLFAFILIAGWWFLWREQLDTLGRRQQEEATLKEEFVTKKTQAVNRELYVQQLSDIERSFGALLKQLPDKSEVEALLVEVNQSGMGRGLQFELFKPRAEAVKEFYAELPIDIRLTGNYHDFGAFASDIAKLDRIVTLNNITITPNQQAKDGTLVLESVTKTFRYLDEEELAARKKAGQDQTAKARGRRR
jgi:type IV pilus assembly protein PilO